MTFERRQLCAKSKLSKVFLVIYLFCLACYAHSSPRVEQASVIKRLVITPISCVIEVKNKPCTEKITLAWFLPVEEPFCIYIAAITKPLSCHNQQQGQIELVYSVYNDTQIRLVSQQNSTTLVKSQIMVSQRNETYKRPRNRHAWSIF